MCSQGKCTKVHLPPEESHYSVSLANSWKTASRTPISGKKTLIICFIALGYVSEMRPEKQSHITCVTSTCKLVLQNNIFHFCLRYCNTDVVPCVTLLYTCSGFLIFLSSLFFCYSIFGSSNMIKLSKLDSTIEDHIVRPQLLQLPKEVAK